MPGVFASHNRLRQSFSSYRNRGCKFPGRQSSICASQRGFQMTMSCVIQRQWCGRRAKLYRPHACGEFRPHRTSANRGCGQSTSRRASDRVREHVFRIAYVACTFACSGLRAAMAELAIIITGLRGTMGRAIPWLLPDPGHRRR